MKGIISQAKNHLLSYGSYVDQGRWQARETKLRMFEALNFNYSTKIFEDPKEVAEAVGADLPWAEVHFQERVSGHPLNPAPSYLIWPYYKHDEMWKVENDQFAHTYPERFWTPQLDGIRYTYGNLGDLVDLLERDPYTRQAFLPMWFPEDTGAHHGERVPCTIGYHFILRSGHLHMFYPMRSCDFRRHLHNDIYMAARMNHWVLEQLRKRDSKWDNIKPGNLNLQIWNLHVFEGEENVI